MEKTAKNDESHKYQTCLCGVSVHTGAYIIGFFGMILSGIGFGGSIYMKKCTEAVIEGISTLTYALVFLGRCKSNHHYYLPLLIVHALAIPFFTIIGVILILVKFNYVEAKSFPFILHMNFTLETTSEGLFWTIYNVFTSIIELYFFNVAYRAYMFMRKEKRIKK